MKAEILAPCGDFACMEAAVRSGADAVYFGSGNFNARRNAGNFDGEKLGEAIAFCRARGVKTHITLNTLLSDAELPAALEVAKAAAAAGADALIVQDLGLVRLIRRQIPDLVLHASTQLTIHDVNGLHLAKSLGFSRVVLSRELSLGEIRVICETAREIGMEIEVFAHGALCMSVSGQCYMSSIIGGRSGNRGLCAQPCRLPFSAGGGSKYALSLKDMSHLNAIGELTDLGVTSFKIEGRMKTPEYVAAAVTAAKEARDEGRVSERTETLLRSVFSRSGFTDGYLTGKRTEMFGIRTESDKELTAAIEKELHELYRREYQRIGVDCELTLAAGSPAQLSVSDGEHTISVCGAAVQPAADRPIDQAFAERQLSRMGGTPFYLRSLTLQADGTVFVPPAELNNLRRQALEQLVTVRQRLQAVRFANEQEEYPATPHTLTDVVVRFTDTLPSDLTGIRRAYLPWTAEDSLFDRLLAEVPEVGVELPRTFFENIAALCKRLDALKARGISRALCETAGALKLAERCGLQIDCGMFSQIMNSATLAALRDLGVKSAVVSFENTLDQISVLQTELPLGIVGYGYLPLMIVRCCPLKEAHGCAGCKGGFVTDRLGKQFFVKCRDGASEIFNCVPIYMGDRKRELKNVDFALLYFTRETAEEIETILADWRTGTPPTMEHTRGLYYRGVQ